MAINSNKSVLINGIFKGQSINKQYLSKEQRDEIDAVRALLYSQRHNNEKAQGFNIATYGEVPSKYDIDKLVKQYSRLDNVITNGGYIFGIDTETLGNIEGTQLEKDLFTITEFSLIKKKVDIVDGKQVITDISKTNYAFGIDALTYDRVNDLIRKYESVGPSGLNAVEESTLKRLSMYRGNFNDIFSLNGNSIYEVKKLTKESLNVNDIQLGAKNLLALGSKSINGRSGGNQAFRSKDIASNSNKAINEIYEALTMSNRKDGALIHFNGTAFDQPRIVDMLEYYGKKFNFKNSIDGYLGLEAAFHGNMPYIVSNMARANGYNGIIRKGMATLAVMNKVRGIKEGSEHFALFDTEQAINFLIDNVPGEKNPIRMYRKMLDSLNTIQSNKARMPINKDTIGQIALFANNGLAINGYDYIIDGDEALKTYMPQGVKRNHTYYISDMSYVNTKNLPKTAVEINGQKLLRVEFKDAATNNLNPEKVVHHFKDFEELRQVIENNFGIKMRNELLQDTINLTTEKAQEDNARRALAGMKEADLVRGHKYAQRVVEGYHSVNNAYLKAKEAAGVKSKTPMTKAQFKSLIEQRNNKVAYIKAGKYNLEINNPGEILKPFNSIETMANVYYTYSNIQDQIDTLTEIVEGSKQIQPNRDLIKTSTEEWYKDEMTEFQRTVSLRNAANEHDELIRNYFVENHADSIAEKFLKDNHIENMALDHEKNKKIALAVVNRELENMTFTNVMLGDIHTVNLNVGGEVHRVNGETVGQIENTMFRLLNRETAGSKNNVIRQQNKTAVLEDIAEDLIRKKVIKRDEVNELFKITSDPTRIVNVFSSKMHEKLQGFRKRFGDEGLVDIQGTRARILERVSGGLRKGYTPKELGSALREDADWMATAEFIGMAADPYKVIDTSGRKVQGMSYDKAVKKAKIDTKAVTSRAVDSAKYSLTLLDKFGHAGAQEHGLNFHAKNLMNKYGYIDEEIEWMDKIITSSEFGFSGKQDLLTGFFEHVDENGEEALYMIFGRKEDEMKIAAAISRNELPNSAYMTNVKLKTVKTMGDVLDKNQQIRYIDYGSQKKLITRNLSVYKSNNVLPGIDPRTVGADVKLKVDLRTTNSAAFSEIMKYYKNSKGKYMDKGLMMLMGERMQRDYNKIYGEAKTPTGFEVVDGVLSFIPDQGDFTTSKDVDYSEIVNAIPALYKDLNEDDPEDRKLKEAFDEIFGSTLNGQKQDASFAINRWSKQLENKMKTINDLPTDQRTFFLVNMLEDLKIAEAIVKHKGVFATKDAVSGVEQWLSERPTQLIREHDAGLGHSSSISPVESIAYAFGSGYSRPLNVQQLHSHVMLKDKLSAENIVNYYKDNGINFNINDYLNSKDISFGAPVHTAEYKNYKSFMNASGFSDAENFLTANMKNIETGEILNKLDELEGSKLDELYSKFGGKYSKEEIVENIKRYKAISSTWESHALIDPTLWHFMYNQPRPFTMRLQSNFEVAKNIAEGTVVKKGDIIGTEMVDGILQDIIYPNDNPAVFNSFNKKSGTAYFNPLTRDIFDTKIGIGGQEKMVASIANPDLNKLDLVQEIFDRVSGGKATILTQVAAAKHDTPMFIAGSDLNKILYVAQGKGMKEMEAVYKDIQGYSSLRKLITGFGEHGFDIAGDPDAGGATGNRAYIKDIIDLKNKYITKDGYKEPLEDSSLFRHLVGRLRMNESYNSKGSLDDIFTQAKGVGLSDRLFQSIDATINEENSLYDVEDGQYKKRIHNYLESLTERAKEAGGEKRVKYIENVGNLMTALEVITNTDTSGIVMDIDFDFFNIPQNGMTKDQLKKTIFSRQNADGLLPDAYRIALPDNITLPDYFKGDGARTNILVAARQNTFSHDGKTYLSGLDTTLTKLINDIAIGEDQSVIDSDYFEYLNRIHFEMTHKEGMLTKHAVEGRLDHSGITLAQTVIPPVFDTSGKFRLGDVFNGLVEQELDEASGKYVNKAMNSVIYTSKKQLEDFGFKYGDIGEQLVNEKFFNNLEFAKLMLDKGYVNEKGMINEVLDLAKTHVLIASEWMKREGVSDVGIRFPAILSQSGQTAILKQSDYLEGNVVAVPWYMAEGMNLDTDADIMLHIPSTDNGLLVSPFNVHERSMRKNMKIKATTTNMDMHNSVMKKYEDAINRTGNFAVDVESMRKKVLEERGIDILEDVNYYHDPNLKRTAIFSKISKDFIGYISTPNFHTRDVADAILTKSKEDMRHYKNIWDFGTTTEQKLLDFKHLSKIEGSPAKLYMDAMRNITSGEKGSMDRGIEGLKNAIISGGIGTDNVSEIKDPEDYMKRFINLDNILNDKPRTTLEKQLHSIKYLYSKEEARNIYNNMFSKNARNLSEEDLVKAMITLAQDKSIYEGGGIAKRRGEIISESMEHRSTKRTKLKLGSYYATTEDSGIKAGIYQLEGNGSKLKKGKNTGLSYVTLKNVEEDISINIYGKNANEIAEKLGQSFRNIKGSSQSATRFNLINSKAKDKLFEYTKSYSSILEGQAESEIATLMLNLNKEQLDGTLMTDGTFEDILERRFIKDEASVARIRNNILGASNIELNAMSRAFKDYSDDKLKAIRYISKTAEALQNTKLISEDEKTSFIREMNNLLLTKGEAKAREATESFVENKRGNIVPKKAIQSARNKVKYNPSHNLPKENPAIQKLIQGIENIDLINEDSSYLQLQSILEKERTNINQNVISKLGEDEALKNLEDIVVNDPMEYIKETNKTKLYLREKAVEELINSNSKDALDYMGWNDKLDFDSVGDSRVGFGSFSGTKIKDIDISTLTDIYNSNNTSYGAVKTKEQIGKYFNALENISLEYNKEVLGNILDNGIITPTGAGRAYIKDAAEAMEHIGDINQKIIEKAKARQSFKEATVGRGRQLVENVIGELSGAKILGGIALGALAIGVVGNLLDRQYTASPEVLKPERKGNGSGSPSPDGAYDELSVTRKHMAPATPKTARVEENTGLKYRISGKSDSSINHKKVANAVQHAMANKDNVNVNINTKDDRSKVNKSWLEEKLSELL